jgi:hypothetical protein
MDAKHRAKQVFVGVVVMVGCAFASPLLLTLGSGHVDSLWKIDDMRLYVVRIGALSLFTSLSAYLICTGLRMVKVSRLLGLGLK